MNIGLLGGSFNPCHKGHIHISKNALKELKLDEIWWVITPLNPLKEKSDLADIKDRVLQAKNIQKPYFIKVKLFEKPNEANYSVDLIRSIKAKYHSDRFIWLMGADNLVNFVKWKSYQDIIKEINIAVFPREDYLKQENILNTDYHNYFLESEFASLLKDKHPPYWTVIKMNKIDISATKIRNQK
ncbi:MAG: nicotinate (nicotinamide) nucleotide adenylyltransferase [Rickettsiales bacterium]|nr:nicotinate (nicotinamide) nucleotide adenylyltransferase [Rickettsiales bacterium]